MKHRYLAALTVAIVGCSSAPDTPSQVQPIAGRADVRSELAAAIVDGTSCHEHSSAAGCDAFRRDVDAWTSRLSDAAICAAARHARERPIFSLGIDMAAAARREIVVDLARHRAAVYTKAAGDLVDDRAHLYTIPSESEAALPIDDEAVASQVALLEPDVAKALRAMIGPDGSPYGEGYARSDIATRKLAGVLGRPVTDGAVTFADARATASAVVRWSHAFAPLAMKAALLAVARDAPCTTVSTSALHILDETTSSDLADFSDFDDAMASWLGSSPSDAFPADEAETETIAANCSTDPDMGCGSEVCTNAGGSFCCSAPLPITKPCTYDTECGDGSSCVLASNEPDANGNQLTCAPLDPEGGGCSAVENAAQTARTVSLMYEGTCAFLRANSKWSRNAPAGQVMWGCEGLAECSDSDRWVAGPAKSYCGKTVQFCRGSKCTTAKVRDISVAKGWEGSQGVMDGLGAPYGTTKATVRVL